MGKSTVAEIYVKKGNFLIDFDEIIKNKIIPKFKNTKIDSRKFFGFVYNFISNHNIDKNPLVNKVKQYFIKIVKELIKNNDKVVVEGQLRDFDIIRYIFGENNNFTFYVIQPANENEYIDRLRSRFDKDPDNYGRLGFLYNADKDKKALKDYKKYGLNGKIITDLINRIGKKRYPKHKELYEYYKSCKFDVQIYKN